MAKGFVKHSHSKFMAVGKKIMQKFAHSNLRKLLLNLLNVNHYNYSKINKHTFVRLCFIVAFGTVGTSIRSKDKDLQMATLTNFNACFLKKLSSIFCSFGSTETEFVSLGLLRNH